MKNRKVLQSVVPEYFDVTIYDACKDWSLKIWAEELSSRWYMRDVLEKEEKSKLTDEIRAVNKLRSDKLIERPLNNRELYPRPFLPSVIDQSAEEFFRGHLVIEDRRYKDWVVRMLCAEKFGDEVLDGSSDVSEWVHDAVNEFYSAPAWKVHRDSLVSRSHERFFVGVDLRASDDHLVSQFKSWIKRTRSEANVNAIEDTFNKKSLYEWHENRLLPYLDLAFWGAVNNKIITNAAMEDALFPGNCHGAVGDRIRKKTAPMARTLIQEDFITALQLQVRSRLE